MRTIKVIVVHPLQPHHPPIMEIDSDDLNEAIHDAIDEYLDDLSDELADEDDAPASSDAE